MAEQNVHLQPFETLSRKTLLLVLLVYIVSMFFVWNFTLTSIKSELSHTNSTLTQSVKTTLKGHELILRGLGKELITMGALEQPENGRALMERMKQTDPGMSGFGLAKPDGQLVLVSNVEPGVKLPNLALAEKSRDSFQDMIQTKQFRTGRVYYFEPLQSWVLPIRAPLINEQGKIEAVSMAAYFLNTASVAWQNTTLPEGMSNAIIRGDGYRVFYHPSPEDQQETILNTYYTNPVSDALKREIGSYNRKNSLPGTPTDSIDETYHFISYDYITEYDLHTLTFIKLSTVIMKWLQHMLFPSLLITISLISGYFVFRSAHLRLKHSNSKIQHLTSWQQAVLDSTDYSVISTDINGIIASYNVGAQKLLGYTPEELIHKETPYIFHDTQEVAKHAANLSHELGKTIEPGFEALVAKARLGMVDEGEWTYIRKDGARLPVRLSITPMHGTQRNIIGFLGVAYDLTQQNAITNTLLESENRYTTLFENTVDAIFLMRDNRFVDCNPATLKIFGCQREDIIDKTPDQFSPQYQPNGETSIKLAMQRIQAAFSGKPQWFEWQHCKLDKTTFDAEVTLNAISIANEPHLLATVRDITERKNIERMLKHQAGHDSLTELPNRNTLHESFHQHLQRIADKEQQCVAMLLIDLDKFKEINDTLGHHYGDQLLIQVGPRLLSIAKDRDTTIARLGGDEFAIIVSSERRIEDVMDFAREIRSGLRKSFEIKGLNITIDSSVGVSCYPHHGQDSHELLRAADIAMYEAKRKSLGVELYKPEIDIFSRQRLEFASQLTDAIANQEFVFHYQPKIDLSSGHVVGFEALARWQHPQEGLLYPDRFIDLLEMSDSIHDFTLSLIALAGREKALLQKMGFIQPVAINLSTRNLLDDSCLIAVKNAIRDNLLTANEIELELTESSVMINPEKAIELMKLFNNKGINIAIDDFGTGYSSLTYLRQFPVASLKIDRSFIMNMTTDDENRAIVKSTIALAHSLNLKVIAEGVEDQQTQNMLKEMGCEQAQGYGICRPVPLEDLVIWLKERNQNF